MDRLFVVAIIAAAVAMCVSLLVRLWLAVVDLIRWLRRKPTLIFYGVAKRDSNDEFDLGKRFVFSRFADDPDDLCWQLRNLDRDIVVLQMRSESILKPAEAKLCDVTLNFYATKALRLLYAP